MKDFSNLTNEELQSINGGWNPIEYVVMGIGYVARAAWDACNITNYQ